MFWGLSPALDLLKEYSSHNRLPDDKINILLLGGRDARHIIMTLAKMYKHGKRQINFICMERCPELITRQLLLLSIALENSANLGIAAKTRMFMEIYGNTLMIPSTSKYLVVKAKQLICAITDLNYMKKIIPGVSFEKIKYRERDYIEIQLKFWQKSTSDVFDICELWDRRVRTFLGPRYDVRNGAFDWDYYMRLKDISGITISSQEFNHFRETGVAFTWMETEVSRPNCTLAAGILSRGETFVHRGYLGDIHTGPYITYGMECEDASMMKTTHGNYEKRATDIIERNLMRMFHEIEHKSSFDVSNIEGNSVYNLGVTRIAKLEAKMVQNDNEESCSFNLNESLPSLSIEPGNIAFYSFSNIESFLDNDVYKDYFHVAFVGNDMSSNFDSKLLQVMESNALILCESAKFNINLTRESIKNTDNQIITKAHELGIKILENKNSVTDSLVKLQVKIGLK